MSTISEILVDALAMLSGLLCAVFVSSKLRTHVFRDAVFIDLIIVLGFLVIGVACLIKLILGLALFHLFT